MKSFKVFISEETKKAPRIDVEHHGDWNQRVFFEAYLKDSEKNWLTKSLPKHNHLRGEATVDITGDGAYINRIDAPIKGQKFGSELLEAILTELKKRNFKTVRCYIEANNPDSKMLFKKFGFKEVGYDRLPVEKRGHYYAKDL